MKDHGYKPDNTGHSKLFKLQAEKNVPDLAHRVDKGVIQSFKKERHLPSKPENTGDSKLFKPQAEKNVPYQAQIKQSVGFYRARIKYQKVNNQEMVKIQDKGLKKMLGFFQKQACFSDWSLSRFSQICQSKAVFSSALKKELTQAHSSPRLFKTNPQSAKLDGVKTIKSQFKK